MIRVVVVIVATMAGVVLAPGSAAAGQVLWEPPPFVTDEAAVESPPQISPMNVAQEEGDDHHGMWGGDWEWWIFMAPMMLLFWVGVIALVFWLVRQNAGSARNQGQQDALEIARARYARGEISREEFEQIRGDLGRG